MRTHGADRNSPRDDDDKVHDVPHVPEVAARVEHEALRQDLEARLHREDAQEVGLGRLLRQREHLLTKLPACNFQFSGLV